MKYFCFVIGLTAAMLTTSAQAEPVQSWLFVDHTDKIFVCSATPNENMGVVCLQVKEYIPMKCTITTAQKGYILCPKET